MRFFVLVLVFSLSTQAMPVGQLNAPTLAQNTSFDETYVRFHGVYDIPMHLNGLVQKYFFSDQDCLELNRNNFATLGGLLPSVERSVESQPGAFYIDLYRRCMKDALTSAFSYGTYPENFTFILGDDAIGFAKNVMKIKNPFTSDGAAAKELLGASIGVLDPSALRQLTERSITHVAGPREVWRAAGLVGPESVLFPAPLNEEELITTVIQQATVEEKNITVTNFIINVLIYVRIATLRG